MHTSGFSLIVLYHCLWYQEIMDLTFEGRRSGDRCARECCKWESLTSYSPVGNARKSTGILLIDMNKDTRPRATPIKRFEAVR